MYKNMCKMFVVYLSCMFVVHWLEHVINSQAQRKKRIISDSKQRKKNGGNKLCCYLFPSFYSLIYFSLHSKPRARQRKKKSHETFITVLNLFHIFFFINSPATFYFCPCLVYFSLDSALKMRSQT